MVDGTQSSASSADGISIGLGFDARVVTLGDAAAAIAPPVDPCP